MEGGPPMFRQDCTCPALLKDCDPGFPYGAVTRYGPPFQTLPVPKSQATGLVRFRSPLLAESRLMSFPPATEMFQFAGFASAPYGFSCGYPSRVGCPIRRSRDQRSLASPRAFRSVPRPSSPLSAKASTRCPYFALERHTQRQGSSDAATSTHRRADIADRNQSACGKHSFSEDTSSRDHHPPPADTPSRTWPWAAHGLPLRSHNSLLYDCQSAACPAPQYAPPPAIQTLRRVARLASGLLRKPLSAPCRSTRATAALPPVVEVIGIEPTTSCLQSRCSPS